MARKATKMEIKDCYSVIGIGTIVFGRPDEGEVFAVSDIVTVTPPDGPSLASVITRVTARDSWEETGYYLKGLRPSDIPSGSILTNVNVAPEDRP